MSGVHQLSGLEPISQSPFVHATVAASKRSLAKPKVRKEPVTVEMLAMLVDSLGKSPSLSMFGWQLALCFPLLHFEV